MTQEEKAKAYSKVREKIAIRFGSNVAEEIFSEFEDSEDERIRKALISVLKSDFENDTTIHDISVGDIIAWLEKQGEKKPTDKVEPKFKVGDWIVNGNSVLHITNMDYGFYQFEDSYDAISIIDEKYRLWTIQDARDGDILFHSDSASNGIFIFKGLLKYEFGEKVICYCDYDSEDHFCLGEYHICCWADAKILHPATKEQRDLLFKKLKEAGYEWDAEKKELKKNNSYCQENCKGYQETGKCFADGDCKAKIEAEQNPAWSKEDEQHIDSLLKRLDGLCRNEFERTRFAINEDEDWLKSLKERYAWKPSEEQLSHLRFVCDNVYHMEGWNVDVLEELYNDLKNLK